MPFGNAGKEFGKSIIFFGVKYPKTALTAGLLGVGAPMAQKAINEQAEFDRKAANDQIAFKNKQIAFEKKAMNEQIAFDSMQTVKKNRIRSVG